MKVGPLGCLALLGAGAVGWVIGRVPDVLEGARRDVAAAEAGAGPELALATAVPGETLRLAPAQNSLPAATAQLAVLGRSALRQAGGRQHLPSTHAQSIEHTQSIELANLVGAGVRQPDESAEAGSPSPPVQLLSELRPPSAPPSAFAVATAAYAELAKGHRRSAAAGLDAALAAEPAAANAPAWARDRRALNKRWSANAYVFVRDGGNVGIGLSPLLGGGQSGASLAWTPMPLARRPLYAVARITAANAGGLRFDGFDNGTAQAAAGVRWQVVPQLSLSAERLFAVGRDGRAAWTLRAAGGVARHIGPLVADAYAEGGVLGIRHRDLFAGAQARVVFPLTFARLRFEPGGGLWSGIQHTGTSVERVDLGPTLAIAADDWHLRAAVDYRFRVAGNAAPGSGPAVTVSSAF